MMGHYTIRATLTGIPVSGWLRFQKRRHCVAVSWVMKAAAGGQIVRRVATTDGLSERWPTGGGDRTERIGESCRPVGTPATGVGTEVSAEIRP